MTSFDTHVTAFFTTYLPGVKGASPHTIRSYRDASAQFIAFAADSAGERIEDLGMADVGGGLGFFAKPKRRRNKDYCRSKNDGLLGCMVKHGNIPLS